MSGGIHCLVAMPGGRFRALCGNFDAGSYGSWHLINCEACRRLYGWWFDQQRAGDEDEPHIIRGEN